MIQGKRQEAIENKILPAKISQKDKIFMDEMN